MLKAWKQAWKKEVSSSEQSRADRADRVQRERAGSSSLKRPRNDPDDESRLVAKDNKRIKVQRSAENVHAILPDVVGEDETMDIGEAKPGPNVEPSEDCSEVLKQTQSMNSESCIQTDSPVSQSLSALLCVDSDRRKYFVLTRSVFL